MGDEDEVKATIFGTPLAIKGIAAIVVVILALALAGLIYLLLTFNKGEHLQQSEQQSREHDSLVDTLKSINETNKGIGELLNEQNYMVLSDEKERQAMKEKLRRPSSLSRKLRAEPE